MPIIQNTAASAVPLANKYFMKALLPRWETAWYPKICAMSTVRRPVEPFALYGAPPLMAQYGGQLTSLNTPTQVWNLPNHLFMNFEFVGRTELEFDSTGTLYNRVAQHAARLVETTDYSLATRVLKGSLTAAATETFQGTTYNVTMDGKPIFSATHTTGVGDSQSNIVTGNLPASTASYIAQDIAITVQQMQRDASAVLDRFASFTDNAGGLLYGNVDLGKRLVVMVPPLLGPAAKLAFSTLSGIGGSGGTSGSSGTTPTIGPMIVKEVVINPLLKGGYPSPFTIDGGATVTPISTTEYYFYIDDDQGRRPFYVQRYLPPAVEGVPGAQGVAYSPEGEARAIQELGKQTGINIPWDLAAIYGNTEIANNFDSVGANAQLDAVQNQRFFVSCRTRYNVGQGWWGAIVKVPPTGVSS